MPDFILDTVTLFHAAIRPDDRVLRDLILENNDNFQSVQYWDGTTAVRCDNQPRDSMAYGLKWRRWYHEH